MNVLKLSSKQNVCFAWLQQFELFCQDRTLQKNQICQNQISTNPHLLNKGKLYKINIFPIKGRI